MNKKEKGGLSSMSDIVLKFQNPKVKVVTKKPPHEKAATVDEIQKVLGFSYNDKYGYVYWLRKVRGRNYNEVMGMLKQIEGVDKKYNKGGLLTNMLSNKKPKINK